ncbi:putative histone-like DNA-binding protein [Flavobacterium sp. 102]|nr:putative histone-like DNA-binding protein [Flavobacterium sp. 102]
MPYGNYRKDVRKLKTRAGTGIIFVLNHLKINPYSLIIMAVQFKMVAKQNNLASPPELKYYPCAVHQGETDLDALAEVVASRSTVSKADCYGVIIALTEAIGETLKDGRIVKINSLGTFQLVLQGTAADTPDDLGKVNIKGSKIVYKPSSVIKNKLKDISFKRLR